VALAQRVQELSRFRSEFFGRLRDILGNRPDIRIIGDRFVFQSEVFFDRGAAVPRPEALQELDKLASAILELESRFRPTSIGRCGWTATPTADPFPPRNSPPTGNCPPPAPLRWCSI